MLAFALFPEQDWVKPIYEFGPAALLVFVTSVTLLISSRQLKSHPNQKLHEFIYISNWALMGLLVLASVVTFFILHIKQQAIVRGAIDNLPESYQVKDLNSEDFAFYVRKEYSDSSKNSIRYHWLATRDHRADGATTLSIEVYAPLTKDQTTGYDKELRLTVDESYYEQPVDIVYSSRNDSYTLRIQGRADAPIQAENIAMREEPSSGRSSPGAIVYAASTLDPVIMKNRLEATDPMIRRDARADLAKLGLEAIPFINNTLVDSGSSVALLLGVLNALDLMDNSIPSESRLSGKALAQIIRSRSWPNGEIAKAATSYITKRGATGIHRSLRAWLTANQGKGIRLNDVALADMDLLCDLGNSARESYRRKENSALFVSASNAFEQAWSDRKFAEHSDQIYFSPALYGWALLLADRAMTEKDKNGEKNLQFVRAAKDKFLEFLQASQENPGAYPREIEQAKAYVKNPAMQIE
jgi:hypothetical protein